MARLGGQNLARQGERRVLLLRPRPVGALREDFRGIGMNIRVGCSRDALRRGPFDRLLEAVVVVPDADAALVGAVALDLLIAQRAEAAAVGRGMGLERAELRANTTLIGGIALLPRAKTHHVDGDVLVIGQARAVGQRVRGARVPEQKEADSKGAGGAGEKP